MTADAGRLMPGLTPGSYRAGSATGLTVTLTLMLTTQVPCSVFLLGVFVHTQPVQMATRQLN